MERRRLGKTDLHVSPVAFGAWAIGGWMWGGANEQDAIEAIQASIDHGVNVIDTAPVYGMGLSEKLVGKAIKGMRDKVIVATKCGMRWDTAEGRDPWTPQLEPGRTVSIVMNSQAKSIQYECEQSLTRLGVDVIDLYQIHWPDPGVPMEESWKAMVQLKEQGKVRAIGVSNYSIEQLEAARKAGVIDSLQPPYSIVRRGIEKDLLPYCRKNDIGVLVYSPLERGLLTGKITSDYSFAPQDHRETSEIFSQHNRHKVQQAIEKIRPIAQHHGVTIAQLLINWTVHVPGITAVLVGGRNAKQGEENAKAMAFTLSLDEFLSIRTAFDAIQF